MVRCLAFPLVLTLLLSLTFGCATVRETGEICESEVSAHIADVFRAYEEYRDDGLRAGHIAESRLALEQARATLFGEGELSSQVTPCPRRQQRRPSWRELRDDFETAEILVKELEDVRGVRFQKILYGTLIWTDQTTGKEVPANLAESI